MEVYDKIFDIYNIREDKREIGKECIERTLNLISDFILKYNVKDNINLSFREIYDDRFIINVKPKMNKIINGTDVNMFIVIEYWINNDYIIDHMDISEYYSIYEVGTTKFLDNIKSVSKNLKTMKEVQDFSFPKLEEWYN